MRKKRGILIIFLTLLLILPSFLVSAQIETGQVGDFANNVSDQVEGLRDFVEEERYREIVEEERYSFLGEQWKEFLLRNRFIASVDNFFTKINFLFVILFSRSWSFSLSMFIVFLFWLFTALSIEGYLISFNAIFLLRDEWERALAAFAITIVLAHMQIFNTIADIAIKIIFFKKNPLWFLIATIALIMVLIVYLERNKYLSRKIQEAKKKNKQLDLENKVKAQGEYLDQLTQASKGS